MTLLTLVAQLRKHVSQHPFGVYTRVPHKDLTALLDAFDEMREALAELELHNDIPRYMTIGIGELLKRLDAEKAKLGR